jgi:hypothetical protein
MRKFGAVLAAGLALATVAIPQAAFATDPEAQQYAYEQCSQGQWAELGYASFNQCTYYKIQEWEINHP